MPLQLKNSNATITLQAPIQQLGGGAVDSVNGMTGDVVLDIPNKTSQLQNDSDFATNSTLKTEIAGLATKSELAAVDGKIPAHVVEYTKQALTAEQKKQARDNIDAGSETYIIDSTVASDGTSFVQFGSTFNEIYAAIKANKSVILLMRDASNNKYVHYATVHKANPRKIEFYYAAGIDTEDMVLYFKQLVITNANVTYITEASVMALNNDFALPQKTMSSDPTEAMQIATKQYVDDGLAKKAPAGDYVTNSALSEKGYLTLATLPKYTGGVE